MIHILIVPIMHETIATLDKEIITDDLLKLPVEGSSCRHKRKKRWWRPHQARGR
jgi:hypothetical protein